MKFKPFFKLKNLYAFEIILKVPYNESSLERLIKRGKDLGFVYIDCSNPQAPLLSVDALVNKIVNSTKSVTVKVKAEDTFIMLSFGKTDDNLLMLTATSMSYRWIKQTDFELDWGSYDIDLARYMRLLLSFTDNFLIQQIKTYTKPAQYE